MKFGWPEILPGGGAVLFTVWTTGTSISEDARIAVLPMREGKPRTLFEGGSGARYCAGYILFHRSGGLWAAPFDPERLMAGASISVLEGVAIDIITGAGPDAGHKDGGSHPRWRSDGKELFYVATNNKLMAAVVMEGSGFEVRPPVALFEVRGFDRNPYLYPYAVTADGQRFLIIKPVEDASSRPITIVQNWTALLKR